MLIDFLWQNIEKIGSVADMKISDLFGVYPQEVFSVKPTDKAYHAFREMLVHRVSGLAVIDENGALVDNISFRDYKVLYASPLSCSFLQRSHSDARTFWRLWDTVQDFKVRG
jgi:CBS-domain-containing membrane protein